MGASSKTTKSKNEPIYKKEIEGANAITQDAYQNNKGAASDIAGQFGGLVPDLLSQYQKGDPTINAAQNYATNTLNGDFLSGNPYLQENIDLTNDSVANQINSRVGMRGQTGGSAQYEGLSKNLAENESRLRYQDYATERQNMNNMAALSPGLAAGQQIPLAAAMAAGESAVNLPWVGANNVARNTAGLLGQYQEGTQKQSGGFLGDLMLAGVGAAGSYFSGAGSDIRLKTNIKQIGALSDGMGVYEYDYIDEMPDDIKARCPEGRQIGVMAHEVEQLRPWALGPVVDGFATVNYGEL